MFRFKLPANAGFIVQLPTGGSTLVVHAGDGEFLSKVPPIMFEGVVRGAAPDAGVVPVMSDLPVWWDGDTLPGDSDCHSVVFVYDGASAVESAVTAADSGDLFAIKVVAEMKRIDDMIAARDALMKRPGAAGVVVEPEVVPKVALPGGGVADVVVPGAEDEQAV